MNYRLESSHKYRAIVTEVDGIRFPSKKQAMRYRELKISERAGIIRELKLEVPYDLVVNGMKICRYVADFTYRTQDGRLVVEDTKGVRTRDYKIKAKLMLACLNLRVLETWSGVFGNHLLMADNGILFGRVSLLVDRFQIICGFKNHRFKDQWWTLTEAMIQTKPNRWDPFAIREQGFVNALVMGIP
jgi:hypothetical protein